MVEPTPLKNMRKSNWIICSSTGENSKNIFELPPSSFRETFEKLMVSKLERNIFL